MPRCLFLGGVPKSGKNITFAGLLSLFYLFLSFCIVFLFIISIDCLIVFFVPLELPAPNLSLCDHFFAFIIWQSGLDSGDHFLSFGIAAGIRGAIFTLFGTAARRPEIMVSSCGTVLWIQETICAWFLGTRAGIPCAKTFVRLSAMLRAAG